MPIQTAIDSINNNQGSPFGFKNRIINGAMVIDQRNAGASVTPADGTYTLDRFVCYLTQASKFTVQQNAGSVTPPAGFTNYLGLTVGTSANVTVSAGDYFLLDQVIEGYNLADLGWGTANAKTVTLSFWVRSSLTGTFGGALKSYSGGAYGYPFTYTISTANTWEQKTITIDGPTSTWAASTTNGGSVEVLFSIGTGSTYTGASGSWQAASRFSATGATNLISTNSATFYITGVQLEKGSTATSFDYRDYGRELIMCQRYYYATPSSYLNYPAFHYSTSAYTFVPFPVLMRTTPTVTATGAGTTFYEAGVALTASGYALTGRNQGISIQVGVTGGTSGYAGTFYPLFQASAEL